MKLLIYLFYLLMMSFLGLEIVFRILPTSDNLSTMAVDASDPVIHFAPNRIVNKQTGFNFSHYVKKKINNYGYFSDSDYFKVEKSHKSVALIGDSFVEAVQVKNSDSLGGRLALHDSSLTVYTLGVSGSPLSQYLAFSEFVIKEFDPHSLIFVIVGNDFDESHISVKNDPGFHYFDADFNLVRMDYKPSNLKSLARKSALIRYLYLDLKIHHQIMRILNKSQKGMGMITIGEDKVAMLKAIIDQFLIELDKIASSRNILLIFDADRAMIYNRDSPSWPKQLKISYEYLKERSKDYTNIKILDLHNFFEEDYKTKKKKFEFPYDSHWNEDGHRVAFESILSAGFLSSTE